MSAHKHVRETLGGDEIGSCCGQLVTVSRVCRYCWARFRPERSASCYCSKPCSARAAAWSTWVRVTREAAAKGRTGPAMPAGGASLLASVSRFQLSTFENAA